MSSSVAAIRQPGTRSECGEVKGIDPGHVATTIAVLTALLETSHYR